MDDTTPPIQVAGTQNPQILQEPVYLPVLQNPNDMVATVYNNASGIPIDQDANIAVISVSTQTEVGKFFSLSCVIISVLVCSLGL